MNRKRLSSFVFLFEIVSGAASLPLVTFASATICASRAGAQTITSGDVAGVVVDSSGAAVPSAVITLKGEAKGTVRKVLANSNGAYGASLHSPDIYDLTVTAQGFETTTSKATASIGQITSADIRLTVGASNVTVEVTDETSLLETETAETTTALSEKVVQSLPNPGTV